ncbi:hypothetical protein T01_8894 [Trichinella spiralis]|uniref:Uncharacterized protein n=1 Tax=Trichinella spiralis TaxID=6334 RepID=A0A0V1B7R0_TRISP|nr:hypothetical protein T01_8894 [Trichinella spiralis]
MLLQNGYLKWNLNPSNLFSFLVLRLSSVLSIRGLLADEPIEKRSEVKEQRMDTEKGIIAVAWYDKRRILATSTNLGMKPKSTVKRSNGRQ